MVYPVSRRGRSATHPGKLSVSNSSPSPSLRIVGLDEQPATGAELLESALHEEQRSAWNSICVSFSEATGVDLKFFDGDERPSGKKQLWSSEVPAVGPYAPGMLTLEKRSNSRLKKERVDASCELADQVGSLIKELQLTQRALKEREAELATAIPLIVRADEEPSHLAKRYAAILDAGVTAVGCDAAGVYILDDNTQSVKLRCHHGLSDGEFVQPPRMLRESQGDIYALAGQAVVLTEITEMEEWCIPGEFAAAVCVPISSATMPLGTFWMYSKEEREFTDAEVNIIEVIAGRMATELEREILLREQGVMGATAHANDAIEWQQSQLPRVAPPVGDWKIAARPSSRSRLHGDYYHWHACEDDTISLTLSSTYENGIPAALTAATIGGLARQQAEESPVDRLNKLNQALWAGSEGDHNVAVFCGSLDENSGGIELISAGQVFSFVIRPHSWEAVQIPNTEPAGCGESPVSTSVLNENLQSGDILLVLTGRPRRRPRLAEDRLLDAGHYAEALLLHSHLPVDEMTNMLASLWDSGDSPWETPPAIMIAKYRS